ncbi:hypothetical protein BJ508DRAFT_316372, partial [Ascobolus immersus RN42]
YADDFPQQPAPDCGIIPAIDQMDFTKRRTVKYSTHLIIHHRRQIRVSSKGGSIVLRNPWDEDSELGQGRQLPALVYHFTNLDEMMQTKGEAHPADITMDENAPVEGMDETAEVSAVAPAGDVTMTDSELHDASHEPLITSGDTPTSPLPPSDSDEDWAPRLQLQQELQEADMEENIRLREEQLNLAMVPLDQSTPPPDGSSSLPDVFHSKTDDITEFYGSRHRVPVIQRIQWRSSIRTSTGEEAHVLDECQVSAILKD